MIFKNILLTINCLIISYITTAQYQCNAPTLYTNDGEVNFPNINNIDSSDNLYNSVNLNQDDAIKGWFTNFNFNIPLGATIVGYGITIEGYFLYGANDCKKYQIELCDGTNKGTKYKSCDSIGNGSDISATFGGPNNLMSFDGINNPILTPTDINNNSFGIKVKMESDVDANILYLDLVKICVYYTFALYIELFSFDYYKKEKSNHLFWVTLSEINNDYFLIERSIDGETWEESGRLKGISSSTIPVVYDFDDYYYNINMVNYYRLSQTDYNGTRVYFDVVAIDNRIYNNINLFKIYNIYGQEVNENYDGIKIYLYDDGSVIKTINN